MSTAKKMNKTIIDITGISAENGVPAQKNFVSSCLILEEKGYTIIYRGNNQGIIGLLKNESVPFGTDQLIKAEPVKPGTENKPEAQNSLLLISEGSARIIPLESEYSFYTFAQSLPSLKSERTASVRRTTKETDISVEVNLDSPGVSEISTGIGFFDHMLDQISRHGNISLKISAHGDLHVDEHHTIEDTGLALGEAILLALGDKKGIRRYGFLLPMDDSVTELGIDLGGRPYLNFSCRFTREKVGDFPTELTEEFFRALSVSMKANIYIKTTGRNDHHKTESIFKAFAKALNDAVRKDSRAQGMLPSTKGTL